jgi:hypothetical protein
MNKVKLPEIYFDWNREKFWCGGLVPGRFIPQTDPKMKNRLQMAGISTELKNDQGLSAGDEFLRRIEVSNGVDYAGPLAGYKAGLMVMNNRRVLITESVCPVMAGKNQRMPTIEKYLEELLGDTPDQVDVFLSWLKVAYESLLAGDFMPGQLFAFGGPDGCGKTFAQWLITQLFGGRSADPWRYMTDATTFNEDLAFAEHLPMGDKKGSFNHAVRKAMAAQIKEFCVESEMSIHGKNKIAVRLATFRRLTLSFNDEPEHVVIIPPIDLDMRRKITIVKCSQATLDKDRPTNARRFTSELPALAKFLHAYRIPKKLQDDRFGVVGWQHPYFLQILNDSAPEMQLLELIEEVLFAEADDEAPFWRGSAETLKVQLLKSPHQDSVRRLLDWSPAACGMALYKLSRKFPDRFDRKVNNGSPVWIIKKGHNAEK